MRGPAPAPPPRRSRRRAWRSAEFAALDFETTGLDPARDEVVSFGVVPVRGGRVEVGERVHRHVAPSVRPSAVSVTVHGLRQADLARARGLDDERATLRAALDRRYLLAWAAEVEAAFLARAFGGSPSAWRRRIVDVLVLARHVDDLHAAPRRGTDGSDGRSPSYALSAAAARFGVPVHSPHDALDDALTTAEVFLVLATRVSERRPRTPGWLLRATRPERR